MPFYILTRPTRPIWQILLLGAAVMLIWATGQAIFLPFPSAGTHPSVFRQVTHIIALTAVGGAVAGALYWTLRAAPFRQSVPLRWLAGTAGSAAYLITFTLAASRSGPEPWTRVTQPSFLLSTLLICTVFGWLLAKDPFGLAQRAKRVYLTPLEFAALAPADQERLRPDSNGPADPEETGSAG